jgi:hypothetical protein
MVWKVFKPFEQNVNSQTTGHRQSGESIFHPLAQSWFFAGIVSGFSEKQGCTLSVDIISLWTISQNIFIIIV